VLGARGQSLIVTGVPRGGKVAISLITSLCTRMQSLLTVLPTESGSLVPWMPITPSPPAKLRWTSLNPDNPKA